MNRDETDLRGIYVLAIQLRKNIDVKVGALGQIEFASGLYLYVGSAQNNLEMRVKRHLSREKRKFWHIDYLLGNEEAVITKVFYKESTKTEECQIATQISQKGTSIEKFGCSDCKCKSHLYRVDNEEFLYNNMRSLKVL